MVQFVSRSEKNNVEKEENAGNHNVFKILYSFGCYNSGLYDKCSRYHGSKVTMC